VLLVGEGLGVQLAAHAHGAGIGVNAYPAEIEPETRLHKGSYMVRQGASTTLDAAWQFFEGLTSRAGHVHHSLGDVVRLLFILVARLVDS
jgi:hypothetical protein